MRAILCCVVALLAFNLTLLADDKKVEKIDPQKLVGLWGAKGKSTEPTVIRLNKDGKIEGEWWVRKPGVLKSDVFKFDGAYKIDGNKLLVTLTKEGEKLKDTWTVIRLSDDELWCDTEKGNRLTYTRRKDK